MISQPKIYVAGHRGMVGSAIVRELERQGYSNLVYRTHQELDLTDQCAVSKFFTKEKPDQVYLAAAMVGGIHANDTLPAEFIYSNLMVQSNVIHQAYLSGVKKLLFMGSSCIYPRLASQPMSEEALLTGKLEPTNEPYAIAKIAGIKMCESYNRQYGQTHGLDYRSVMPTNLYGPGDRFNTKNSHVIPAMISRFHNAKLTKQSTVTIWGTGTTKREFLHVDDLAKACIFVMDLPRQRYKELTNEMQNFLNVGYGEDLSIKETAFLLARIIGYSGEIIFSTEMPDGAPRKLLDTSKLRSLGWTPEIKLEDGLKKTYEWFLSNGKELSR